MHYSPYVRHKENYQYSPLQSTVAKRGSKEINVSSTSEKVPLASSYVPDKNLMGANQQVQQIQI